MGIFLGFLSVFFSLFLLSKEKEQCKVVRLSDIGWTDISATTALASLILESIGYEPKIKVLSVPVTLSGLKNNDLDVFLGNWLPSQKYDIEPFLKEKSILQIAENLSDAKYTIAVPKYAYLAGVKDYSDLHKFKEKFDRKIYGIGAGNEGNGFIAKMIATNDFLLGDWQLIASSEQGMMVEVEQAFLEKRFIAFLGWSPHPMNLKYEIAFLTGGDNYFGPNFGQAKVYTISRRDFVQDCPNLAQFFKNLKFNISIEERMMKDIIENKATAKKAAFNILKNEPEVLEHWLKDVKTFDEKEALLESKNKLFNSNKIFTAQFTNLKIPLGFYVERFISFITTRFATHFRLFSSFIENFLESLFGYLLKIPAFVCILFFALIAFFIRRSIIFAILLIFGFGIIDNLGYFDSMLKSLVLVLLSTLICVIIGIPLGILGNRYESFYKILRPILDLMQTIPTFVFLLPTLMLFGLGIVPGLVSTIIFALSAPIRLTYLGLSQVPHELKEAADAFGASPLEKLIKVELVFAKDSILAGVTQCIMLSLSMVVIAALVGAEGLGEPVIIALNTVNIGQGIESGICIVILAIILDRLFKVSYDRYRNC